MLKQWNQLIYNEKLGHLLAKVCDPEIFEIIGIVDGWLSSFLGALQYTVLSEKGEIVFTPGHPKLAFWAALHLFGFITLKTGKPEPCKGWNILEICKNKDALPLAQKIFEFRENMYSIEDRNEWLKCFRNHIKPLLPDWNQILVTSKKTLGSDVITFSVREKWTKARRVIALPGSFTLHDLGLLIVQVFQILDDDHGYVFEYKDDIGRCVRNYHPWMEDDDKGAFADEVTLSDLPLDQGDSLKFLFDFGSSKYFDLTILKNNPQKTNNLTEPLLVETDGRFID
jgi:Plasmid pRiA4b ORF-3-like protein